MIIPYSVRFQFSTALSELKTHIDNAYELNTRCKGYIDIMLESWKKLELHISTERQRQQEKLDTLS